WSRAIATRPGERVLARPSTRCTYHERSTGCTWTTSWNGNVSELRNWAYAASSSSCLPSSSFASDSCGPATSITAQYSACPAEPKHTTPLSIDARSRRTWTERSVTIPSPLPDLHRKHVLPTRGLERGPPSQQ